MHPLLRIINKYPALLLFGAGSVIGALLLPDYGVGWDEHMSNVIGIINYRYVFEGDLLLLDHPNRDYGVAFELPAVMLQRLFSLEDTRHIYLLRHAMSYMLFLAACCAMYKLAFYLYRSIQLALLAFLLLYLHPLLFSHAFFNSKDLPFLSGFAICLYALTRATGDQSSKWFALAGLFTGLLTATRILGIALFALGCFFAFVRIFRSADKRRVLKLLVLYVVCTAVTLYAAWPFLWTDPVDHFLYAFGSMARFRWDLPVLFNGEFIPATQVPASYVPVWFTITTPLFVLAAGSCGLLLLAWKCLRGIRQLPENGLLLHNVLYAASFLVPVLAVIVMHSVIYDSWRHLFFVYPGFVLLCVFFVHHAGAPRIKNAVTALMFLLFVPVIWFLVRYHPLQHVYFNALAGGQHPEGLRKKYELDYWGVSYKQGLEYLLEHDTSRVIRVSGQNDPCGFNIGMLKPAERRRLELVDDISRADYFLTNYRWYPQGYADRGSQLEELHSLRVFDNSVMTVFRVKH